MVDQSVNGHLRPGPEIRPGHAFVSEDINKNVKEPPAKEEGERSSIKQTASDNKSDEKTNGKYQSENRERMQIFGDIQQKFPMPLIRKHLIPKPADYSMGHMKEIRQHGAQYYKERVHLGF